MAARTRLYILVTILISVNASLSYKIWIPKSEYHAIIRDDNSNRLMTDKLESALQERKIEQLVDSFLTDRQQSNFQYYLPKRSENKRSNKKLNEYFQLRFPTENEYDFNLAI